MCLPSHIFYLVAWKLRRESHYDLFPKHVCCVPGPALGRSTFARVPYRMSHLERR